MKRKDRLILVISLLLVAGFLVTSLGSYFISRASLRSEITLNQLPLTSDNIYSEIQRDLLRPIFISSLMASDTFLRDWVIDGEREISRITRYLKEIQTKYATFTSFFVSERTRTYYHAEGILKKVSPNEPRDLWYFRVRKMAPDFEINVDPDMANKDTMTIFINYRVHDYRGNYIGATGVGLKVSAVIKLIETYQERYGCQIYFIDKEGNVQLHGSTFPKTATNLFQMEGLSTMAGEILANKKNLFIFKKEGKTTHLNTRYVPQLGWYLLVEQTEEAAIRHILQALLANLAICAVITIVVVFLVNLTIKVYQNRLEKMATEDKLTGAYNRHAFDILYDQTLREAHRKDNHFSLILFDIDDFKRLNDNFGHLAGDAVLQNIVKVTQGNTRDSDMLCRWGGEEFLVILKECDQLNALRIAEKIRNAIKSSPTRYKGEPIPATVSMGVAQYRATDDEDSLLGRVDEALFRAKEKGKDRSESESAEVS
jgi:diguanylate cyclase (GGDEF)-like protein